MKRWIVGTVTAVLVTGGIAAGTGVALADTGTPAPTATSAPAPASGKGSKVCTDRIPKALQKIDTLTTRINGDASTKGSTAWLQAKEQQARSSNNAALADLIQNRLTNRPARVQELAQLKAQLQGIQSKDCA